MKTIKPRNVSGLADYTEAECAALSGWFRTIEDTYRLYGFSRLFPRPLELREVLLSRGGIQKQIFGVSRLPNDTGTDMALPFDRTVPLAYWVAKNANDLAFPYKRYDISHSFRGERAQAGRFQAFLQADIDIIGRGSLDLTADAECIAVLFEAVLRLGLGEFYVAINHMGLPLAILRESGVADEQVRAHLVEIDKLQKTSPEAVARELSRLGVLGSRDVDRVVTAFSYQGDVGGFLGAVGPSNGAMDQATEELSQVWAALLALGVPPTALRFWPRNVRGLDYYTGTVFETFLTGHESIGSIASGGRFDDLASTFTPMRLPGVGGSIGLTRLFDTACKGGLVRPVRRSEAEVFVGFRTVQLRNDAQRLASALRGEAVRVDLYSTTESVGKQLGYSDKKGIPVAVIVMDPSTFVIREMGTGTQMEVESSESAVSGILEMLRG